MRMRMTTAVYLSPSSLPLRRRHITTTCASHDHVSFIEQVAAAKSPHNLPLVITILQAQGQNPVSPGDKKGFLPLIIPLTETTSGALTALLRWPTAPPGMDMPIVQVHKYGVWLLAKNVDNYIHRILAEEDAHGSLKGNETLLSAASNTSKELYKLGDFAKSRITDIDTYLLRKVGLFPDVIERKAELHLKKGDHVSALVTGEFYTKNHFPGFGRPFVVNAEILLRVGRKLEAKDAARGALKSPWWTLGCRYQEVAAIAEWEDEQIEYIKEKVSEEGKQEDLKKGKAPMQVALDEAAFLLDLASVEGNWSEIENRISRCYVEAGLPNIAKFILYRD